MARPRPKSRVDLLVDSLTSLRESAAALNQIDLRHTRGVVRDHIKTARAGAATARKPSSRPCRPICRRRPAADQPWENHMAPTPLTVTRYERGRRVREFRPGQRADTLEAVLANARSGPPTAPRQVLADDGRHHEHLLPVKNVYSLAPRLADHPHPLSCCVQECKTVSG